MKNNHKISVLFIGPITKNHGQGIVTYFTFNILCSYFSIDWINTNIQNLNFIKKILSSLKIILLIFYKIASLMFYKEKTIIYFTPSRNFFSSLKDFNILFITIILKKLNNNIFLIGHLHGSDLKNLFEKGIYGKFLHILYKKNIDRLIINSESHKKFSLGSEFNNYKIIDNPIEISQSTEEKIKNKMSYRGGKIKILFISIPTKQKGLMESIKLIKKFFNNGDWEMNVIGWDENEFKKIYQGEQNIDSKTLKRINFLGRINDEEKFKFLLKSDLFILLSYKEAQPLSVIEAGIFKCAIILSEIEMLLEFKKFQSVLFNNQKLTKLRILKVIQSNSSLTKTSNVLSKLHSLERYKKNIVNSFIF